MHIASDCDRLGDTSAHLRANPFFLLGFDVEEDGHDARAETPRVGRLGVRQNVQLIMKMRMRMRMRMWGWVGSDENDKYRGLRALV